MDKIKIIHIVKTFDVGGVESIVKDLSNSLAAKADYDVFILSLGTCANAMKFNLNKNVKFIDLGFKTEQIRSPLYSIKIIKSIYNLIKDIDPVIVNSHLYFFDLLLLSLALKLSGDRIHVRTVHSSGGFYDDQLNLKNKFRIFIEILSSKLLRSFYIGVSQKIVENNQRFFGKHCIGNELLHNFIETSRFQLNKKQNSFQNEKFKVIYVARLEVGKNHLLALRVLTELKKRGLNIEFVFAGSGTQKKYLELEACSLGIDRNVTFLGVVHNIPDILIHADIAIFPSEYEGFSVVLLEKMACKLPVICSDIDAFSEVIINGENGYIAKSVNDYVNIIEYLYFNKSEIMRVGENAFLTANNFSIDNAIVNYNKYYLNCLTVFNKLIK